MDDESNWSIDCDSLSMEISNGAIIPGTVEGNTALFGCTTSASARPGTFAGKIEFIEGDKKIHSAEFLFVVERRPQMIEQNYNLNTIPSASPVPIVHVSQYDKGSRTLKFKLFGGSGEYSVPLISALKNYGLV